MPSWHLVDAAEIAAKNKYTFYKPSDEVIAKIAVGEVVKLIFAFESDDPEAPGAERMWVLVDSIEGNGCFSGRLNNEPYHIKDIALDDPVSFRDIHIINTKHDDDDNIVEKYIPRCFVTNRILKDGLKIGYLYREEPDNEQDSGWRILAGDESDEYMDDAKNIAFVSLGAVLSRDDSILTLLDSAIGAAFERSSDSAEFVAVNNA
ncbi:immunity protein Imm33 domain-containing protein [Paraherbaspirillum soli]|uniref:DUF2185 domain-containing protein n=1 Tax=Paraherbaspirillum soli TaxID=631222 RepID=A0ABW0MH29_9BURK